MKNTVIDYILKRMNLYSAISKKQEELTNISGISSGRMSYDDELKIQWSEYLSFKDLRNNYLKSMASLAAM